jgi:hypothetical protein
MTPRFRLRTLLILLAVVPPLFWFGWTRYQAWRVEQEQGRLRRHYLDEFGVPPPPRVFRASRPD